MDENFRMLGRRVKLLRMDKGMTQTKMANLIGLSQTNLSNMESGRTAITIQNPFKIHDVLQCKMTDFFMDFDADNANEEAEAKKEIELEGVLQILKLLKAVNVKGFEK